MVPEIAWLKDAVEAQLAARPDRTSPQVVLVSTWLWEKIHSADPHVSTSYRLRTSQGILDLFPNMTLGSHEFVVKGKKWSTGRREFVRPKPEPLPAALIAANEATGPVYSEYDEEAGF